MGGRVVRLALDRLVGPRRCPEGVLGEDARPRPDEVAIGRLWIEPDRLGTVPVDVRPAAGNPSATGAGCPRDRSTRTSASITWVIRSSGLIDRASVRICLASSLRPALYRCSSRASAGSRGSPAERHGPPGSGHSSVVVAGLAQGDRQQHVEGDAVRDSWPGPRGRASPPPEYRPSLISALTRAAAVCSAITARRDASDSSSSA